MSRETGPGSIFLVGIVHNHPGKESQQTTLGQVRAQSPEEARSKAYFWVDKKKKEHNCEHSGRDCTVFVSNTNATELIHGIEDIERLPEREE